MTYKLDTRYIGAGPLEPFYTTAALALSTGLVSSAAQWPPTPTGIIVDAEDPVWGPGQFIFAKANGTIRPYGVCSLLPVWNSTTRNFDWNATEVANTVNLGRMIGVCISEQDVAATALTTGQFGWFCVSGLVPALSNATVAADTAIGIVAAGQLGALAASKQIVNARVVTPATQTVVVASVAGASGDSQIQLANVDGIIQGGYLSGTGVGAAAIVRAINRQSNTVKVSVVNSAAVTGNVTCTYNNATIFYNVVHLNRSFAQGAIT